MSYLIQKFENDNLWLVEKLTEVGNENEFLKSNLEAEDSTRGQQRAEFDTLFKQVIQLYDIYNFNDRNLIAENRFTRFKICFH